MPTIFRLDASIRLEGSISRAVATSLESTLSAELGDIRIIHREIGLTPLPSTAWAASMHAHRMLPEERTAEQKAAAALSTALADELEQADAYIFAVPLYNFGVSEHMKTWIDLIITEPRFSAAAEKKAIAGRPAYLVVARGGAYGAGTPREGWDHATPWLKRIFVDVWGLNLEVVEAELTLAATVPAMFSLRDMAAASLANAHDVATEHGRLLGQKLTVRASA